VNLLRFLAARGEGNTYVGHWPDAVDTTRALVDAALGRPGPALRVVGG
jgi:hypothetical protein